MIYSGILNAQSFITRFKPTIGAMDGYLELDNGQTIKCDFINIFTVESVKSLFIKDAEGTTHKLKAKKVEAMYIRARGIDKWDTVSSDMSIKSLFTKDFNSVPKTDYFV